MYTVESLLVEYIFSLAFWLWLKCSHTLCTTTILKTQNLSAMYNQSDMVCTLLYSKSVLQNFSNFELHISTVYTNQTDKTVRMLLIKPFISLELCGWQVRNSTISLSLVLYWCTAQYSSNCCMQLTRQQLTFGVL